MLVGVGVGISVLVVRLGFECWHCLRGGSVGWLLSLDTQTVLRKQIAGEGLGPSKAELIHEILATVTGRFTECTTWGDRAVQEYNG